MAEFALPFTETKNIDYPKQFGQYLELFDRLFKEKIYNNLSELVELMATYDAQNKENKYMSKWCYFPFMIDKYKTFNCTGVASMLTSHLISQGQEAYLGNPIGHAVTVLKDGKDWIYLDPRENIYQKMKIKQIYDYPELSFVLIELSKNIGDYSFIPFYRGFDQGVSSMHANNHRAMMEDKKTDQSAEEFYNQLKQSNKLIFSETLPRVDDLVNFKNSSIWRKEKNSSITNALYHLKLETKNRQMNFDQILSKGKEFVIKYLTSDENYIEYLIGKTGLKTEWIDVRKVFWTESEHARNTDYDLFYSKCVDMVTQHFDKKR